MSKHDDVAVSKLLGEVPALTAAESSRLSDRLARLDDLLDRLPNKLEVAVKIGTSLFLTFQRVGKDSWGLALVSSNTPDKRLCDCSIQEKIIAIASIPQLLERLTKGQFERLQEIKAAHQQLDDVERMLGKGDH